MFVWHIKSCVHIHHAFKQEPAALVQLEVLPVSVADKLGLLSKADAMRYTALLCRACTSMTMYAVAVPVYDMYSACSTCMLTFSSHIGIQQLSLQVFANFRSRVCTACDGSNMISSQTQIRLPGFEPPAGVQYLLSMLMMYRITFSKVPLSILAILLKQLPKVPRRQSYARLTALVTVQPPW